MRIVLASLLIAATAHAPLHAQGCAATPEAAARAAIGTAVTPSTGGFRVADIQLDPVMKRAWLRVVRCDDANAPAVLVAITAPVHNATQPEPITAVSATAPPARPVPIKAETIIHTGDAVQAILATSAMHMTLDAVANQPGAIGDVISLTLKRRAGQAADEPDHRIRGIVRAHTSVEVQP